jgi:hypothetical protein
MKMNNVTTLPLNAPSPINPLTILAPSLTVKGTIDFIYEQAEKLISGLRVPRFTKGKGNEPVPLKSSQVTSPRFGERRNPA